MARDGGSPIPSSGYGRNDEHPSIKILVRLPTTYHGEERKDVSDPIPPFIRNKKTSSSHTPPTIMLLMGMCTSLTVYPMRPIKINPRSTAQATFENSKKERQTTFAIGLFATANKAAGIAVEAEGTIQECYEGRVRGSHTSVPIKKK